MSETPEKGQDPTLRTLLNLPEGEAGDTIECQIPTEEMITRAEPNLPIIREEAGEDDKDRLSEKTDIPRELL